MLLRPHDNVMVMMGMMMRATTTTTTKHTHRRTHSFTHKFGGRRPGERGHRAAPPAMFVSIRPSPATAEAHGEGGSGDTPLPAAGRGGKALYFVGFCLAAAASLLRTSIFV
ncbi:hypothetical protein niasHT_034109 [Heterodera trifolii]|uniref:Uncharacterized protein n=1 Tax=Heterodera trifolii TaxID=157864 RepID=A0ABD2ILZ4_9BILA